MKFEFSYRDEFKIMVERARNEAHAREIIQNHPALVEIKIIGDLHDNYLKLINREEVMIK